MAGTALGAGDAGSRMGVRDVGGAAGIDEAGAAARIALRRAVQHTSQLLSLPQAP